MKTNDLTVLQFSPPYGDCTIGLFDKDSKKLFSPPYGDGIH